MKKTTFWKSLFLLCGLIVGSTSAWATDKTITINRSSFSTGTATSYGTYSWAKDGIDGSGTILGSNQTAMQQNGNNRIIYSTTPVNGKIKSITIKRTSSGSNQSYIVYGSATAYSGSGTSYGTSLGSKSVTTSGATWTANTSSTNYRYFVVYLNASNACYLSEIQVTYEESPYTITSHSNNNTYGTVSTTGAVITANPNEGYRISKSNPYTISPDGSSTVVQKGNKFVVTQSANTTVTVNFEEIPTHTATFIKAGEVLSSASFAEDAAITFPAKPSDIGNRKFMGWGLSEITNPTSVAPDLFLSAKMGENDVTYYAVYATFVKETEGTETLTASTLTGGTTYGNYNLTDDKGETWVAYCNQATNDNTPYIGMNTNASCKITSPEFLGKVTAIKMKVWNGSASATRTFSFKSEDGTTNYGTISVSGGQQGVEKDATLNNVDFNKFVITVSDALQFRYIEVTYNSKQYTDYSTIEMPVKITSAEYATYYTPAALDFSETGVTAYIATDMGSYVKLNEIDGGQVPANTPVVLYKSGADGTAINVPVIASAAAIQGTNDLRVSTGTDVANMFVLAKKNNKVGFYKWAGSNLSAGKVYLLGQTTNARDFIGFDETTTGIANLNVDVNDNFDDNAPMYNLAGQRVTKSYKGVVIVNGKKMLNK